jgi:hypothetical protein
MIKYKTENQGKYFVKISRWYPSTKTCSNCKNKKNDITLNDRIYHCDNCKIIIDRDINAAINILREGIKLFLQDITNELYLPIDLWRRIDTAINQLTLLQSESGNTELQ